MSADLLFTICNNLVLPAWLLLLLAPRWKWTLGIICSGIVPMVLAIVYLTVMLSQLDAMGEGGFGSLEDVMVLFQNPYLVTVGWIHYLAFDLFIGSWEVKDSQRLGIPHWQVVPCLVFTFLLGPVGLGLYFVLRTIHGRSAMIYTA